MKSHSEFPKEGGNPREDNVRECGLGVFRKVVSTVIAYYRRPKLPSCVGCGPPYHNRSGAAAADLIMLLPYTVLY